MSIYSRGFDFKFGIGKAKEALIVVLIVAFVVFALFTLYNLFSQTPLEARFEQNPWKQDEKQSVLLFVKVSNTAGADVSNAVLKIQPKAQSQLVIFPQEAVISETLAPNDSRILTFNIRNAVPSRRLAAGKYTIALTINLGGKEFTSQTILEVQ